MFSWLAQVDLSVRVSPATSMAVCPALVDSDSADTGKVTLAAGTGTDRDTGLTTVT